MLTVLPRLRVLAFLFLVVGMASTALPRQAFAEPGDQVCSGEKVDLSGEQTSHTITAPEGQVITGYCVKAGSANQGLGPEYQTVDPPQISITITHSSGKAISHYSVTYADAPVVTVPPVVTQPPVVTVTPVTTQPPVVTVTPVTTQPPVMTVTPVTTQPPVMTVTPVTTQPPVVTVTPVTTQPPPKPETPANPETPAKPQNPTTPSDDDPAPAAPAQARASTASTAPPVSGLPTTGSTSHTDVSATWTLLAAGSALLLLSASVLRISRRR